MIAIDAYPDQHFQGQVTKLAEGADPSGGLYAVEVSVTAGSHKLAPGLFCTLKLQPPAPRSYTFIPASALAEGEGTTGYVYSLNEDNRTVKKVAVQVAFLEGDRIAVSSGLEDVQQVVTKGVGYLTETSHCETRRRHRFIDQIKTFAMNITQFSVRNYQFTLYFSYS